jgi:hypothetical protein
MNSFEQEMEDRAMSYGDDGEEIVEVDADLLYDAWRDRQMEESDETL